VADSGSTNPRGQSGVTVNSRGPFNTGPGHSVDYTYSLRYSLMMFSSSS